jgi:hypothetical protein
MVDYPVKNILRILMFSLLVAASAWAIVSWTSAPGLPGVVAYDASILAPVYEVKPDATLVSPTLEDLQELQSRIYILDERYDDLTGKILVLQKHQRLLDVKFADSGGGPKFGAAAGYVFVGGEQRYQLYTRAREYAVDWMEVPANTWTTIYTIPSMTAGELGVYAALAIITYDQSDAAVSCDAGQCDAVIRRYVPGRFQGGDFCRPDGVCASAGSFDVAEDSYVTSSGVMAGAQARISWTGSTLVLQVNPTATARAAGSISGYTLKPFASSSSSGGGSSGSSSGGSDSGSDAGGSSSGGSSSGGSSSGGAAPTVSSIAPSAGPATGGTAVTITANNVRSGATAKINGSTCTGPTVTPGSPGTVACTAPAYSSTSGTSTKQAVEIINSDATNGSAALYMYAPTDTLSVAVDWTGESGVAASSGNVSAWADIVNGVSFGSVTGITTTTLNGLPAISCNGTSSLATATPTSAFGSATTFTVAFAFRQTSSTAYSSLITFIGTGYAFFENNGGSALLGLDVNGGSQTDSNAISNGTTYCGIISVNGASSFAQLEPNSATTLASIGAMSTVTTAYLCNSYLAGTSYGIYNGAIGEIIGYAGITSGADNTVNYGILKNKWGCN